MTKNFEKPSSFGNGGALVGRPEKDGRAEKKDGADGGQQVECGSKPVVAGMAMAVM